MLIRDILLESHNYMAGHCHIMAIAIKKLHPKWKLKAHIGWDEDAEDDDDYRIDHIYAVDPKSGKAYDCRGEFSTEEELLGPNETGGVETQIVPITFKNINYLVRKGELAAFTSVDLDIATKFAKSISL